MNPYFSKLVLGTKLLANGYASHTGRLLSCKYNVPPTLIIGMLVSEVQVMVISEFRYVRHSDEPCSMKLIK